MNPAAVQFAKQKAGEIMWQDEISGESKNVKLDKEMQERYKHKWPAGGDKAMYGVVDETYSAKARDGRFVM